MQVTTIVPYFYREPLQNPLTFNDTYHRRTSSSPLLNAQQQYEIGCNMQYDAYLHNTTTLVKLKTTLTCSSQLKTRHQCLHPCCVLRSTFKRKRAKKHQNQRRVTSPVFCLTCLLLFAVPLRTMMPVWVDVFFTFLACQPALSSVFWVLCRVKLLIINSCRWSDVLLLPCLLFFSRYFLRGVVVTFYNNILCGEI